jgi:nucleotide-binding universal stress UspA family protein
MKILLATDGSEWSAAALETLVGRPWPAGSQVCVLSVAHPAPFFHDPFLVGAALHYHTLEEERQRAAADVDKAAELIRQRAPELEVVTRTAEGSPQAIVLDEATKFGADLILIGSHGRGAATRFLLGSVSNAVALHAPCSVEIVRHPGLPRPSSKATLAPGGG